MIEKKLLTIAGAFIGISMGLLILLSTFVNNFSKTKSKVFVYTFLFFLGFILVSLIGYSGLINNNILLCIIFQVCFLCLGIIHTKAVYHNFEWTETKKFYPELGFTAFIWCLCIVPFTLILSIINDNSLHLWMAGSSLFFIIPLFFQKSFETAIEIPEKVIKKWTYPLHEKVEDPTDEEMKEPLIVNLLIERRNGAEELTNFKIKAPKKIRIGKLYYFFLEDYNEQHPESPIETFDRLGRPYTWYFYFKPKWQRFNTKYYVDPDMTVSKNGISENSIIICERVVQ